MAKYYHENKKRLQKLVKDIKTFLNKKKKRCIDLVMNDTEIFQKMKNKSLMCIEKKYYRIKKMLDYNYKKLLF